MYVNKIPCNSCMFLLFLIFYNVELIVSFIHANFIYNNDYLTLIVVQMYYVFVFLEKLIILLLLVKFKLLEIFTV